MVLHARMESKKYKWTVLHAGRERKEYKCFFMQGILNNTVNAEYRIKVAPEKIFANKKAPFYAYKYIYIRTVKYKWFCQAMTLHN